MIRNQQRYKKRAGLDRQQKLKILTVRSAIQQVEALLQAGQTLFKKLHRPRPVSLAQLLKRG